VPRVDTPFSPTLLTLIIPSAFLLHLLFHLLIYQPFFSVAAYSCAVRTQLVTHNLMCGEAIGRALLLCASFWCEVAERVQEGATEMNGSL
jgi:hypothetical protein